jgi:hypothetical protein
MFCEWWAGHATLRKQILKWSEHALLILLTWLEEEELC